MPRMAAARSGALVGQPDLVGDDAQLAVALAGGEHGAHEIPAGRRIDPGRPQHDRARARRQHRLLAGELARAVDALRRRGVGLDVGRALERRRTHSRSRRGSAECRPPRTAAPAPPARRDWRGTRHPHRPRPHRRRYRPRHSPPAPARLPRTPPAMLAGRSKSSAGRPTRCTASPGAGAASASATASCPVPPVTRIGAVMSRRVPLAAFGQPRQRAVLVGQDRLVRRDRPGDRERRDRSRSRRVPPAGRTAR